MGSLVEDLLLLARLDQSREFISTPVDIKSTINDVVESARAAGPHHPITLHLPPEDLYTLGDSNQIHQVIANLLANARTHTPATTPITISAHQSDDGITISVADAGPGLNQEDQKQIFERFFRVDPSRARRSNEGSGLGLSIVDSVMRAHGAELALTQNLARAPLLRSFSRWVPKEFFLSVKNFS